MRFALILITVALMLVVGFSWVPADINHMDQSDSFEDFTPGPIYYNTVPVEHIEFEPLHVNVYNLSHDSWDEENHTEL